MTADMETQIVRLEEAAMLAKAEAYALDRELLAVLGHAYVSPEKYPRLYRRLVRLQESA